MADAAVLDAVLAKERALEERLKAIAPLIVAYSGGVDSAYLAFTAHRVLGAQMLAVTAVSPSLSGFQRERAEEFARRFAIPHMCVESHEFENERYLANAPDRCYHCKTELFGLLENVRTERRFASIAYGINADDVTDYRPGHKAALEHGVAGPLLDAGLTKREIRDLSARRGLPTHDDPASPCLSSRLPFLERIDATKVAQVEAGEAALRQLGFREMRVRHHGDVARIEVPAGDIPLLADAGARVRITEALHKLGFKYVTLDLDGFRSGSMTAEFRSSEPSRR